MNYTAKMKYSAETITKLTEMQYNVFQYREKLMLILASVFSLFLGFYMKSNSIIGVLLIFIGCILITGLNTRPRSIARMLIKQFNGVYPSLSYTFSQSGFASDQEKSEMNYSSVIRLIEDKKYLYIYVTKEKAYMIDSSTLSPNNLDGFKEFISSKTGLKWSKPFSLFSLTIGMIPSIFKSKIK